MNKLLITAAILAATAAQAGYYERIPNDGNNGYIPTPQEREQAYRQQQLDNQRAIYNQQRKMLMEQREAEQRQQQLQNQLNDLRANQPWR